MRGAGGGGLSRRNRRVGGRKACLCWRVHMEPFFVRVHMEPFLCVFTWNLFLCVFTWNLFCACSHGTFCDSFDHYLQSLLPGVRRASGTAPAGLSSDLLPGYFRVTDEEFSLLFLFVCVNLSPVNLLQGGSRPASRGQNKYSTQGCCR